MTHKLTSEIEQAVRDHHGFIQVAGQQASYVLMSIDVYRDLVGVGSEGELAASLHAIQQGLADVDAGRTRPFREILAELR